MPRFIPTDRDRRSPAHDEEFHVTDLIKVPFHDNVIEATTHDGQLYVVVRKVCENLGIADQPQAAKLKSKAWAGTTMIVVPSPGGPQETFCLALAALPAWLFSINVRKVKPALRETLALYQREAADVLYRHFLGGSGSPDPPRLDIDALADKVAERLRRPPRLASGADPDLQVAEGIQVKIGRWLEQCTADVTTIAEISRFLTAGSGYHIPSYLDRESLIRSTLLSYGWRMTHIEGMRNGQPVTACVYVRPRW